MARTADEAKQRTRGHVIADLSVNHLERFILEEGHVPVRLPSDYGYDLAMQTFDGAGHVEAGAVYWQLKASDSWNASGGAIPFDLDVRDFNLWMRERFPVILVLHDAGRRRAYWLDVQAHFAGPGARRPRTGAKTVRVRVPEGQRLSRGAIRRIRGIKQAAVGGFTWRVVR